MTERLIRLWRWVGARRFVAAWAVAALGLAIFSGGIALGAAQEEPAAFPERADAPPARTDSTVVEAVVMRRRGNTLLMRTREGDLLRVRVTESTRYRVRNREADAAAVTRGAKVVVIGRPLGEGIMRARAISVQGRIPPAERRPDAIDQP